MNCPKNRRQQLHNRKTCYSRRFKHSISIPKLYSFFRKTSAKAFMYMQTYHRASFFVLLAVYEDKGAC